MFLKSTSFVQKTCTLIANLATVLSVVPMINSFQKVTVLVGHHSTFTPGVNAAWLNVVGHTHLSNSSRSTRDATLPHTHPWLRKNIPVCFNKTGIIISYMTQDYSPEIWVYIFDFCVLQSCTDFKSLAHLTNNVAQIPNPRRTTVRHDYSELPGMNNFICYKQFLLRNEMPLS